MQAGKTVFAQFMDFIALGPRVIRRELEPVGEAFVHANLERVVGGSRVGLVLQNCAKIGVRPHVVYSWILVCSIV